MQLLCQGGRPYLHGMDANKLILILGAGRSSSSLIRHLLSMSEAENWTVHVGDLDVDVARQKVANHPRGEAFAMSATDQGDRDRRIREADLVISMLPAFMHPEVASVAIEAGVHVLTPSYISPEMKALDAKARAAGVLVLNEMGLDPGIDHMSAMKVIDEVRAEGGVMTGFASYCGGLVAPESDDNPWHYKLSWNPRNVVLAGQGGAASFLEGGTVRVVPPHRTFQNLTSIEVEGRMYDGYPNRDSLSYKSLYGLDNVETLVRGTLRGEGFCEAWDALVQMGMVRDDVTLTWAEGISWADWTRSFLPASLDGASTLRGAVAAWTGATEDSLDLLEWLGLFDAVNGPSMATGTPAQVIERLVTEAWKLGAVDRDMIVMWHRFDFTVNGEAKAKTSSLCLEGKDSVFTAMSDTVGLPMALAAKPMLEGGWGLVGVHAPMMSTVYDPILQGLEDLGISFVERDVTP